jgi:phosphate transport system substrate-binding protein
MRRSTLFAVLMIAAMILGACAQPAAAPTQAPEANTAPAAEKVTISMAGSTTVQPLAEKLAGEYMKANQNLMIDVKGGGSGVGVKSAVDGTAMIGMASRKLSDEEKTANPDLVATVIARDGIALIVNPDVTVEGLTLDQARDIFMGKITNWKDLGGEDQMIIVVSREEGSGTRTAFQEMVMKKDKDGNENLIADTAILLSSNGAILTTISSTPYSLGYLSMGYLDATVKALKINDVAATEENAANGTYSVVRPLNFLTKGQPAGDAKAFIDWILSDAGQTIVKADGYISAK